MNNFDSSEELFAFIRENAGADTDALRLRFSGKELPFSLDFALTQIEARRAARVKLRHILENESFLFPNRLSAEQATAEEVASFHASLGGDEVVKRGSDEVMKRWLDMTAGLGVDAMAAARAGFEVTACELNPTAAKALAYNAALLGFDNITVLEGDSIDRLKKDAGVWDVIFIDPARRDASQARTYAFADCEPDVVALMPLLKSKGRTVMVKASPMLDISQVIRELPEVSEIVVTALRGECKEVLAIVRAGSGDSARRIRCVNILAGGSRTMFECLEEELGEQPDSFATEADIDNARFLFEPDAAVMKTGAWRRLTADYPALKKVSKDTHLFVTKDVDDALSAKLPGRVVEIGRRLGSKELKRLKGERLNVVCRNYGMKADELRRKLRVSDGGDSFLYAFRDLGNKSHILIGQRRTFYLN